jgi:hypothetical protein
MPYILGLDLGQAADFSALAILEQTKQVKANRYGCRGLKRWPLGTSYPAIVAEVAKLVEKLPLKDAKLVIDGSGVGRPVVDMFTKAHLSASIEPVIITAGQSESQADRYHHVAKVILVSSVQVLLQERRLQFAAALTETPILVRELENYRVKVTPAANESFNAREGEHDDLVLALALACWWGERRMLRAWII